jgi:hypothetical protein
VADTSLDLAAMATRVLAAWLDNPPDGEEISKLICETPVIAGLVMDMATHALRGQIIDCAPTDGLIIYTDALRLSVMEQGL